MTGNTALSGLTGNMGQLQLANGATLTTSAGLDNSGNIYVDGPYGDSGGGSLTINGTLTNSAQIEIGNNGGAVGTITAQGLDNTGTIGIAGNGNVSPDVMNITEGAAPTTWSGTLNISGDGQLIFASGEIGTIASGAQINLFRTTGLGCGYGVGDRQYGAERADRQYGAIAAGERGDADDQRRPRQQRQHLC